MHVSLAEAHEHAACVVGLSGLTGLLLPVCNFLQLSCSMHAFHTTWLFDACFPYILSGGVMTVYRNAMMIYLLVKGLSGLTT